MPRKYYSKKMLRNFQIKSKMRKHLFVGFEGLNSFALCSHKDYYYSEYVLSIQETTCKQCKKIYYNLYFNDTRLHEEKKFYEEKLRLGEKYDH